MLTSNLLLLSCSYSRWTLDSRPYKLGIRYYFDLALEFDFADISHNRICSCEIMIPR